MAFEKTTNEPPERSLSSHKGESAEIANRSKGLSQCLDRVYRLDRELSVP
uniref:Uncharacterized protein n=1 Tax=Steinernema glaseri TaxID=37863 RepID=A0A1I7ZDG3_9BILA